MAKITLDKIEYELPELDFGAMRQLSKLGFKMTDMSQFNENPFEFVSIMVAFITNTSLKEADKIVDNSFKTGKEFTELVTKLSDWFVNSDFFAKMQAN